MKIIDLHYTIAQVGVAFNLSANTIQMMKDLYLREVKAILVQFRCDIPEGYTGYSYKGRGVTFFSNSSMFTLKQLNSGDPKIVECIDFTWRLHNEMKLVGDFFEACSKLPNAGGGLAPIGINHYNFIKPNPLDLNTLKVKQFLAANQKQINLLKQIRTRQLLSQVNPDFQWGDQFAEPQYKSLFEGRK